VQTFTQIFGVIFERNNSFEETLRLVIESQFDFAAHNPQLPMFVVREILSNKENREWAFTTLFPHMFPFLSAMEKMLNTEISKGTVRPITIQDLLMNIVSINISVFVILPILKENLPFENDRMLEAFLNERCKSNVQFIFNALRP
jgi:hypothetical protein